MPSHAEESKAAASNPGDYISHGNNLWFLTVTCVLAWIVPGFGHFLLKRPKRAVTFFIAIVFLFFWGLSMGAKIWSYERFQPLTFFAMIAQLGVGLPYFLARVIASYASGRPDSLFHSFAESFQFGEGDIRNITFEYGNTFTWVAGLLNFLVILDAFDIATGRKKE